MRGGARWCRHPVQCEIKGQCGCQAFPQRHIKKEIRVLSKTLERYRAPLEAVQMAVDLHTKISVPADEQLRNMPNYNSFLNERMERLDMFMALKDYADSEDANGPIRRAFDTVWALFHMEKERQD